MRTDLSEELARQLVAACPRYLHHNQVALSCGVTPSTLLGWLQRGVTSEEEPYADFARRYYEADMVYCARITGQLFDPETEPTMLRHLWTWHAERWPATPLEASILPLSESKETKRRALVHSLRNPPPELESAIVEAGWSRATRPIDTTQ
jgi:hypothetical protein